MHYMPKFEAIYLPEGLHMGGPEIQDITTWCNERISGYVKAWRQLSTDGAHYVGGIDINLYDKEELLILTPGRHLVLGLNYAEVLSKYDLNKYFIGLAD